MKNREKYPNTDDALKAWKKHKDETGCPCSFSTWKEKPEESDKPKETDAAECPLCHGKHGRFRASGLFVVFHCPDCDALIIKKSDVDNPLCASTSAEFKAWFGKFTAAAK